MLEVFTQLFDPTGFPPRRECGTGWTPALIWLHIFSDLFIWLAYVSIPLVLLYFTRRRDLPFPRIFFLFAMFILACGTTHLIEAIIFNYPVYRLAGVVKFITAVVSWVTVIALIPIIPRVMNVVTEASKPGEDTKLHRPLPPPKKVGRVREYIVAILAAILAILVRKAIDPIVKGDPTSLAVKGDYVFVLALLAVVYVSWQYGFWPALVCLLITTTGYYFLFLPHNSDEIWIKDLGTLMSLALFFFCGVACAALGESHRAAQIRANAALGSAMARQSELESEVVRRRLVEAALRQRENQLVAAQRETAETLASLNAFLDNAPVGIAFFDPDLRYVRINPYLATANGKPLVEHTGRKLNDVELDFPPDLLKAYKRTASSEGKAFTAQIHRPDQRRNGATRVWHITAFPVRESDHRNIGAGVFVQDVTDLTHATEALRESEARFRSMADSVPALIWLSELDGRRTYFNKTWLEFTGRSVAQEADYGWAENIHPEDRELYLNAYRGAFASREPFEVEYRLRRHDGVYRWVLARGTPRFTLPGQLAGFVGLCLDITEQREANEAMRQSEAFRRSVFENSPDCLNILDLDGRMLEVNQAGSRLMELDDFASIEGTPWAELWPAANRETIREAIAAARNGEVGRFQGFCPTAKGTPKYWDASVSTIPGADGRPFRLIGISRDITEHRRAEERIRDSEQRFRTLTEAVPQMVWTTNPQGELTFANRRWDEYTGMPLKSEMPDVWRQLIHPEDYAGFQEAWTYTLDEKPEVFAHEFRLRRADDGEYRWMLAVAVTLTDVTGTIVEWVGTLTDIDDQKRHTQILEALVDERTAELKRSNEELEKFAYIASHDLQEPLRKIQAFGDRLRTKCRDQITDNGKEYIDRMCSAASRMRRLIDDLLTFSRVTTQQRPFVRVEMNELIGEVLSDLDVRLQQTGGTVRVGRLPVIEADAMQMHQLFQNLLVNAVKFHRPGVPPVVEVEGETFPQEDAASGEPILMCRLTVRDNGIGFDEKYRERIFDVFQRLHGRNEYEGTGVGLAICRKIVERHGGTITATGREREGATFVIVLPARQNHTREVSNEDDQQEQANHDPAGRRRS